MTKILGLDIGIASIGHCLIDLKQQKIEYIGVRLFDKAEHPENGSSLAAPRRKARLARRRLNRRRRRLNGILGLLPKNNLPINHITTPYPKGKNSTVWDLRKEGLERKLTLEEWARILYHIAGHRGYQSIIRNEEESSDNDGKKMLQGIKQLKESAQGHKTVAAYLSIQNKQRNRHGSYSHTMNRNDLREEVHTLFEQQEKFGNPATSNEFLTEYLDCAFTQRPLKSSIDLIGDCSILEGEKRAPKHSIIAEQFIAWQRLNNLVLLQGRERIFLDYDIKKIIYDEALKKRSLSFKQLHKILAEHFENYNANDIQFNLCNYNKKSKKEESTEQIKDTVEKRIFIELKAYHHLKKALFESGIYNQAEFDNLISDIDLCHEIAMIISFDTEHSVVQDKLNKLPLSPKVAHALLALPTWSGTISLSHKALKEIVPLLADGEDYSTALKQLGWLASLKGHNRPKLPPFPQIANPVVTRAAAQTRKVVNAYINQFGKPDYIHIEVATDFGKSSKKRNEEDREQNNYVAYLENMKENAKELLGRELTPKEFRKYRLWKEQDGFCLYSGRKIDIPHILDETKLEIDHAIPYSRSFDDSWRNMVLVYTDENRDKSDKTIYEYLKDDPKKWNQFKALCHNLDNPKKAAYISMENFDARKSDAFKNRALNDTRYMARFIADHLQKELGGSHEIFASDHKAYVKVRPGRLTSFLRHQWGLGDKDRNTHYHHAVDAAIIAASNQALVQSVSETLKGHTKPKDKPKPWPSFREDVLEETQEIFISHMPRRSHSGALHKETIYGQKDSQDGTLRTQRHKIKSFKDDKSLLNKIKEIPDISVRDDGTVTGRNAGLYNAIAEWVTTPKDVRSEYPEMPLLPQKIAQGIEPTIITSFKTQASDTGGVSIRGGVADRANMVYIDIYQHKKNKKFFIVPVYSNQLARGEKPNRAIVQGYTQENWPIMDDEYQFLFNLFPKDYVEFINKKGEVFEGYYISTDRTNARIRLTFHNGLEEKRYGIQNMLQINKYYIDIMGNKFKVKS
ncbi:MAG: type II CRISPR RNA-guided endonuclease Cas9 [Alphaproteobacteria bacterium]